MSFKPTAEQAEVINAPCGQRILVQAGPGSGKTEVVARRLAHLMGPYKLRPSQILVLSFSRSAVKALIRRMRSLKGIEDSTVEDMRFLSVRTFDSWAFRMLRFLGHNPGDLLQNDFEGNINLLLHELENLGPEGIREQDDLRLAGIRHFIIDEYQDLAGVRAALVQNLLKFLVAENEDCGFTVLGDPDQAIYDWSITEYEDAACHTSRDLINWIKSAFAPNLVVNKLSVNHRTKEKLGNLVKRASKILKGCEENNKNPVSAIHSLMLDAGGVTGTEEIFNILTTGTSSNGMAVLCRYNSQILQLASEMQYLAYKKGKTISSYRLNAGTPPKPLPSWVSKLLYQYRVEHITKSTFTKVFRLTFPVGTQDSPCSGNAEAAWRLLLGYARYGEDDTSLDISKLRERINWPDSLPDDEGEPDDIITLTTIHQSKGLEYNSVRVVHGGSASEDSEDFHEEGRVLFVCISAWRASTFRKVLVESILSSYLIEKKI